MVEPSAGGITLVCERPVTPGPRDSGLLVSAYAVTASPGRQAKHFTEMVWNFSCNWSLYTVLQNME